MERDRNVIIKDNNNSYRNVFTEPRRMFLLRIFLGFARLFNLCCGIPGDLIFLRKENLTTSGFNQCTRNSSDFHSEKQFYWTEFAEWGSDDEAALAFRSFPKFETRNIYFHTKSFNLKKHSGICSVSHVSTFRKFSNKLKSNWWNLQVGVALHNDFHFFSFSRSLSQLILEIIKTWHRSATIGFVLIGVVIAARAARVDDSRNSLYQSQWKLGVHKATPLNDCKKDNAGTLTTLSSCFGSMAVLQISVALKFPLTLKFLLSHDKEGSVEQKKNENHKDV